MAKRHCGKLSKGYRQRVGLAQALLHNPDVLILDEPTAGLDPKQIIETRKLIRELAGDHTIVLSTHILPEVSQTCQRVVIINKGRVVAVDSVENLTARAGTSTSVYVQIDAAGADPLPVLQSITGVTKVDASDTADRAGGFDVQSEQGRDVRRDLASAIVTRGWGLLELQDRAAEPRGCVPAPDDGGDGTGRRGGWRMSNTLAIADKELRSYFASPIGLVMVGLFVLIYGFFYAVMFLNVEQQAMQFGGQGPMNLNEQLIRSAVRRTSGWCCSSPCRSSRCAPTPRRNAPARWSCS